MRIAGLRAITAVTAVFLALSAWVLTPVFAQIAPADVPLAIPVEVSPDKAKYVPVRQPQAEAPATPEKVSKPKKSKQYTGLPVQPGEPAAVKPAREYKVPDDPGVALAQTLTQSFREDFADVLRMAQTHLMMICPKKGDRKNAAAVLDLDETVMDNRAYFAVHKKFNQKDWDIWVSHVEAPAIPEARDFVHWLKKNGFKVYFVSGRKESQREATVKNLARMGIPEMAYDGIYLKPDNYNKESAGDFKIKAREDIAAKGLKVVMVLGDQYSDLKGAENVGFKLPNPIYFIP